MPSDPFANWEDFAAEVKVAFDLWLKRRGFPPTMTWREKIDSQMSPDRAAKRERNEKNLPSQRRDLPS